MQQMGYVAPGLGKVARSPGLVVSLTLAVIVTATVGASEATAAEAPRGAGLLRPFKQELKAALMSGMAQGVDAAIQACNTRAPEIARTNSTDGVRVGRSSHRLRNPDNVPPAWVAPIMTEYLSSATRAPRAVALADGREGYVEPIVLQAPCLACHGASLSPGVQARLEELYPDDQATGFQVGDLRGVFWIEYPRALQEL